MSSLPSWVLPAAYGVMGLVFVIAFIRVIRKRSGESSSDDARPKKNYAFGPITPALAALLPESEEKADEIREELRQAGHYESEAYQNLSAIRWLGLVLPIGFMGIALFIAPEQWQGMVLAGLIVLPLFGWALPRLSVRRQAKDRVRRIESGMPDLLDMLNMCVSQGLTVQDSLSRIGKELRPVNPDLAHELRIVAEQSRVGSLTDSLQQFSKRMGTTDVKAFTSLVVQTEKLGTSISAALKEHSDSMRESMKQRADAKANRASFWLLLPTVFCLMPAIYLFLLSPAALELSDFFNNDVGRIRQSTEAIQDLRPPESPLTPRSL